MAKSSRVTRPTAKDVRAFAAAHPERFSTLSERSQHTLVSRGQLAQDVIDTYNKGVKPERQYVRGQSGAVKGERMALRHSLIEKGLAGKRGPLSKAAQESLVSK
ncbi:MAG TPA: hypothetical protein VN039_04655 [Nitrospira sp.]|jgi:hypothetical protein|nr:hypothetical protein [Nitrospira sp.]